MHSIKSLITVSLLICAAMAAPFQRRAPVDIGGVVESTVPVIGTVSAGANSLLGNGKGLVQGETDTVVDGALKLTGH
ncbi:hypothetical protein EJ08DRAFT_732680 [Tothia fuscella]|uniref:Uncharacterized protein n=1 Tax=Tothia fuscella TaxID=1048955 RepID=A0A9P4NVW1_9PEZI|nr:hypothetical protein EJ08DRAFT_732680 [Tothia fuscella]